jgi:hydroxymethylglutaryl-CoA lyase
MSAHAPPTSLSETLPKAVRIREVGPRDGFQNEPELIDTADKVRLIELIAATGVRRLEITSFVRADVIPQLADAAEVLSLVRIPAGIARSVIVPTMKGLDRALEFVDRLDEITVFLSASETHNRRNVNRSIEESLTALVPMLGQIRRSGLRAGGAISTSFGCPFEGEVPVQQVARLAERLSAAGAQEISFGDTTGMANPVGVSALFRELRKTLRDDVELTAHFHNTRGSGLANALAALSAGCTSFESSVGEIGGCPVPRGATGNIATEDLVSMFDEMGIDTGIDLEALLRASREVQDVLGRTLSSKTLVAGAIRWKPI